MSILTNVSCSTKAPGDSLRIASSNVSFRMFLRVPDSTGVRGVGSRSLTRGLIGSMIWISSSDSGGVGGFITVMVSPATDQPVLFAGFFPVFAFVQVLGFVRMGPRYLYVGCNVTSGRECRGGI